MFLRIVFENHKYQVEIKGWLRWHKLRSKWQNDSDDEAKIVKCDGLDEAFEHANCYIEQNTHKSQKVIVGYIKI